jgi:acetyl-CoA carboxylase carboxyl transferase subunit beta
MEWFKKSKSGIVFNTKKKEIKDNLWIKCEICNEIIYKKELEKNLWICTNCNAHFRINSRLYREVLLDKDSFMEMDATMTSVDILGFADKKKYADRIVESQKKSGLKEAVITGIGTIEKRRVAIGIMDFGYMGGSMGSVVGEKVARLIRRATKEEIPLVIVSSSGGARMQEGAFSLMQMAKTSAALALHSVKNLPYISVLTHPTTGGTTASFAMLGDVHVAEPGALIGFAGPRVIRETIRQELPKGFQRSEFLLEHGFVDVVCDRRELKKLISTMLGIIMSDEKVEKVEKSDLFVDIKGNLKKKYQNVNTKDTP